MEPLSWPNPAPKFNPEQAFNSTEYNRKHGPLLYVPSLAIAADHNTPRIGFESPRPATMRLPLPKEQKRRRDGLKLQPLAKTAREKSTEGRRRKLPPRPVLRRGDLPFREGFKRGQFSVESLAREADKEKRPRPPERRPAPHTSRIEMRPPEYPADLGIRYDKHRDREVRGILSTQP